VPVKRIELLTFGLQNRCSTAELNRQLIENPSSRFVRRNRWPMGRGRRQISELGGKGYWRQDFPGTQNASYFQAPAGLHGEPRPRLQLIFNHHGLFLGPWGSGLNMSKRRCERFDGANLCSRLGWTPSIGSTARAAKLSGSGTPLSAGL
jgi:hypothetical protein